LTFASPFFSSAVQTARISGLVGRSTRHGGAHPPLASRVWFGRAPRRTEGMARPQTSGNTDRSLCPLLLPFGRQSLVYPPDGIRKILVSAKGECIGQTIPFAPRSPIRTRSVPKRANYAVRTRSSWTAGARARSLFRLSNSTACADVWPLSRQSAGQRTGGRADHSGRPLASKGAKKLRWEE